MTHGICGLVLAGGQGRRMGGVDKGLQLLQGRPLMQHVIERLRPQVDRVLINANQNLERYAEFGCPVVPDRVGGFAGPSGRTGRRPARDRCAADRHRALRFAVPAA